MPFMQGSSFTVISELRSLAVSDPGAQITWQLDLVEAMPLLRSLAISDFQVEHIN